MSNICMSLTSNFMIKNSLVVQQNLQLNLFQAIYFYFILKFYWPPSLKLHSRVALSRGGRDGGGGGTQGCKEGGGIKMSMGSKHGNCQLKHAPTESQTINHY